MWKNKEKYWKFWKNRPNQWAKYKKSDPICEQSMKNQTQTVSKQERGPILWAKFCEKRGSFSPNLAYIWSMREPPPPGSAKPIWKIAAPLVGWADFYDPFGIQNEQFWSQIKDSRKLASKSFSNTEMLK